MIAAWQRGDTDTAMALGRRVQRLADVVFAAPVGDYRVRLKECLRILGRAGVGPRPSAARCGLDDAERAFLASVLVEVGLLEDAASAPVLAR